MRSGKLKNSHVAMVLIWAMVNTHYMVDGHPIHNKDPYNGYYKSLWTIGWLAPINGY